MPTEGIEQVSFLDPAHGYGLFEAQDGGSCSSLVGSTADGGRSFAAPVLVTDWSCADGYVQTGLVFDGAGDGFVFNPGLYVTHDAGATWSDAHPAGTVVAVVPVGTSVWRVVANCAGQPDTCSLTLDMSNDSGRTWVTSPTRLPEATGFGVLAVPGTSWLVRASVSTASLVVPTSNTAATFLATSDGGRTWDQRLVPCLGGWGEFLSRAFDGTLWLACAGQPGAGNQLKSVVRSLDGGRNWVPGSSCPPDVTSSTYPACAEFNHLTGGYLSDIVGLSSSTAFIGGGRNFLQVTQDGGQTWSLTTPIVGDGDVGVGGLTFFNSHNGWAIASRGSSNGVLWRTTDGGATWSQAWPISGVRFPRCPTSQLGVTVAHMGAGAGMEVAFIDFLNSGMQPCSLYGFPGVAGLDAAGDQVMQAVRQRGEAPTEVVISPEQVASAMLNTDDVPVGGHPCLDVTALLVTPPDDTQAVRLPLESDGVPASLHACQPLSVEPVVQGQGGG